MIGKTNSQNIIINNEPAPIPPECKIRFKDNVWDGSAVQLLHESEPNEIANGQSIVCTLNDAFPFIVMANITLHRLSIYALSSSGDMQDTINTIRFTTDTTLYYAFVANRANMYNDPEIGYVIDLVVQ